MKWCNIEGYDNYEVSDEGLVRNIRTGRILKASPNTKGYMQLSLCRCGKSKSHQVHILVAKAFIPNPNNLPQVNHIDEDKSNNFSTNLEWMNNQENVEYSQAGYYIFTNPDGEDIRVFNLAKFCRDNKLTDSNMFHLLSGKYKSSQGWTNGRRIKQKGGVLSDQ